MNQFSDNPISDIPEVKHDQSHSSVVEALAQLGANVVTEVPQPTERITLVAVHTLTSSTLQAETIINQIFWQAINDLPEVVAHWIAMDGRADITDEDSAVFVRKGLQKQVQDHLVASGLASEGGTSLGE